MNPLQRSIIEKTGNDNGFEHVVASDLSGVTLASARHANRVLVGLDSGAYQVRFQTSSSSLLPELQRSFPSTQQADAFQVATEADLAASLRRAASLSRALPSQATNDYQQAVAAELAELPTSFDIEREVKYYDSDTVSIISNLSRRPIDFELPLVKDANDFNENKSIRLLLHDIRQDRP